MKYRVPFLFLVIIIISFFLRFNRLSELYVFNLDEEYQAFYAWQQVLDPHPIWIGLAASALEFYLGPYIVYLTAFLLALSKGDPVINGYFAAFLGVITTAVIFFTGKKVFSPAVGIIAAVLYGVLPLFVFFDQKYWNPMFLPLITVLLFLVLNMVKSSKWWWVVFAGLTGAIFETHLPPLPLVLIGLWCFTKGKYWKDIKLIFFCLFAFLLFYWPLIVFDFNHNFSNLKVFTRLSGNNSQQGVSLNPYAKARTLFDSMGRFWYLKPGNPNADEINFGCSSLSLSTGYKVIDKYTHRTYSPFWLSFISLSLFLYFLVKNIFNNKPGYKLLSTFLIVSGFSFLIYPGGAFEYYALIFLTLFTFVPAILISKLNRYKFRTSVTASEVKNLSVWNLFGRLPRRDAKSDLASLPRNDNCETRDRVMQIVAFGMILIAAFLGINTVLSASDEFSLGPKKRLISKVMDVIGDKPFSIEGRGICHNYEGWRYLFKVYGRTPAQSYTDSSLGWLYPEDISKENPIFTIILSEDRIPLEEDLTSLYSIKIGGYRAYIKKLKI